MVESSGSQRAGVAENCHVVSNDEHATAASVRPKRRDYRAEGLKVLRIRERNPHICNAFFLSPSRSFIPRPQPRKYRYKYKYIFDLFPGFQPAGRRLVCMATILSMYF